MLRKDVDRERRDVGYYAAAEWVWAAATGVLLLASGEGAQAAFNPSVSWTPQGTIADDVTSNNPTTTVGGKPGWTIDSGADSHSSDFYERPTGQSLTAPPTDPNNPNFRVFTFLHQNLDITSGQWAFDDSNTIA